MQKLYKLYNNNKKKLNKKSDILISIVQQCPMSFHMLVRVSLPTMRPFLSLNLMSITVRFIQMDVLRDHTKIQVTYITPSA